MFNETVDELQKKVKELSLTSSNLITAMDALARVEFKDTEKKRTMIDELRQMNYKIDEQRQNVIDAIDALRKVKITNPDIPNPEFTPYD